MDYLRGERLAEILARKYAGIISEDEQMLIEEWLNESDDNVHTFEDFMSGRSIQRRTKEFGGGYSDEMLSRVHSKIKRFKRRRLYYRVSSAAAVLLVGIISGIYLLAPGNDAIPSGESNGTYRAILSFEHGEKISLTNSAHAMEWQEVLANHVDTTANNEIINLKIVVPRGSDYKIELSDGTNVWLNSETVVEYPSRFTGDIRNIKLSGEAFFDVTSDPQVPFVIGIGDGMSVSVRGTRFNVQNYSDVQYAHVTLEEGSVEVDYMLDRISLRPSQQAILNKVTKELEVQQVADVGTYSAWTEGLFSFGSQPIEVILGVISKWYDINVIYENPEKMYGGRITFNANKSDDLSGILETLGDLVGMDYERSGRDLYIRFRR